MTKPLAWLVARPIAHRGLHDKSAGRIENTLSAIHAAIDRDFGIECDVQLSADGEAMVFHDFSLNRLTGETGRIDGRTASELAQIAVTGGPDRIPTLTDALSAVAGRVPVVIEIKSRFDGDEQLTRRTLDIVAAHAGPVAIKSFDPRVLIAARKMHASQPIGIVAMNDYAYPDYATLDAGQKHALANLLHFAQTRPDFVSWRVQDLPSAAPFLCRSALGLPLLTWTVRTPHDRSRAEAHADQIVFESFLP